MARDLLMGLLENTEKSHAPVASAFETAAWLPVRSTTRCTRAGQPCKAHLHTFFGNTGASASSTYDSLRNTGNSTCTGGTANKTAYWIPTMMNDGVPVVPTSAIFYYKAGYSIPNASGMIQKIPAGLRIIAGNSMATAPEPELHA